MGPTASGKTALAVSIAERLNGELVSVDSRQVYRYCDIGTNKPSLKERRGLPCHLLDLVDPDSAFTVADYQQHALPAIEGIAARGKLPVLQGGSGLYLRALLDGWNLADAAPDPELRARLEQELEERGVEVLAERLRGIDPAAAEKAQRNPRRLIRALEIHAVTGRAPSEARRSQPPPWSVKVIGLQVPLLELDQRIELRVAQMLEAGWIEEVTRVKAEFPNADWRRLGHGYPEIASYLQGSMSQAEMRHSTIKQVRQYARRQYTWFRADPRVEWLEPDAELALQRLSAGIMRVEAS